MRELALGMVALFVIGFASPSVATEAATLRDLNYEYLLNKLQAEAEAQGVDFDENMILDTSSGPATLEEAVADVLDLADSLSLNLEVYLEQQMIAQQGSFPINGLGGVAAFLEFGVGGGSLPLTCNDAIHETVVATNTLNAGSPAFLFSKDGTVSSSATNHPSIIGLALGTDVTGTTFDATVYGTTVFAGPNFDGACLTIQICAFGLCLLWVFIDLYAVSGVITDDLGTGTAPVLRGAI